MEQARGEENRRFRGEAAAIFVLAFLFLASVVPIQLHRSLWLDEALTAWFSKQPLGEMLGNIARFHSQVPPLYYLIERAGAELLGSSEIALRVLSLVFQLLAGFSFFFLCRGLRFERAGACFASALFLMLQNSSLSTIDARPYSLEVLFACESIRLLHGYCESRRRMHAAAFTAMCVCGMYTHFFFCLMLPIQLMMIILFRIPNGIRFLVYTWIATAAALLPYASVIRHFLGISHALVFLSPPTLSTISTAALPPLVWVAAGLAVLFGAISAFRFPKSSDGQVDPCFQLQRLLFFLCWMCIPPLIIGLVSYTTPFTTFVVRYYTVMSPGIAALVACLFAAVPHTGLRMVSRLCFLVIFCLSFGGISMPSEDWRCVQHALSDLGGESPGEERAFLQSRIVESCQENFILDEHWRDYLTAPLLYYAPARFIIRPLPCRLAVPESEHAFNSAMEHSSPLGERIFYILRLPDDEEKNVAARLFGELGYHLGRSQSCDLIEVNEYRRG